MEVANETVGTAKQLVDFGEAIKALKQGKRVARNGWNGKGLFIFMQAPANISMQIVPKMQSLPRQVKEELEKRFNDESFQIDSITYNNQIVSVNNSNLIQSWNPTVDCLFANDWEVYHDESVKAG